MLMLGDEAELGKHKDKSKAELSQLPNQSDQADLCQRERRKKLGSAGGGGM